MKQGTYNNMYTALSFVRRVIQIMGKPLFLLGNGRTKGLIWEINSNDLN